MRSTVVAAVLSFVLVACGASDVGPAAPATARAESCEAEMHTCGPTWLGCVHVREAGTTPDGNARFEGDDGALYEARRACGDEGRCTDHCPGGACRPGVARLPEGILVCSFLSGPPAPSPFTCVLEGGACVSVPVATPEMVPGTS